MSSEAPVQEVAKWYQFLSAASVWAGVIGFPIGALGLWWTWLARKAALDASEAASSARDAVNKINTSIDLSLTVSKMRDLSDSLTSRDMSKVQSLARDIKSTAVRVKSNQTMSLNTDVAKIDQLITFFASIAYNFDSPEKMNDFDWDAFSSHENTLIELSERIKEVASR